MWRTWIQTHATVFGWLGFLSLLMFVGTLIALPTLVIRLPSNYFVTHPGLAPRRAGTHPGLHLLGRVLKNVLGCLLLLAGVAMLVLPGQGILTMFLGLTLLDFPGKRALEWRLVQRPMVWQSLNWIRARAHKPPLEWPGATPPSPSQEPRRSSQQPE
ncbi:MAG: PGPGW domain-containing protein [Candidatus Tectimicrobiota bacterium]